jgi:hypothetical protein
MSYIPLTSAKIRRIHPQVNTLSRFFLKFDRRVSELSVGNNRPSPSIERPQVDRMFFLGRGGVCTSRTTSPGERLRCRPRHVKLRPSRARQPLYHGVLTCHVKPDTRRHNRGISLTGRIATRPASVGPGRRDDGRGRKRGMSETDGRRIRGATGDANADRA